MSRYKGRSSAKAIGRDFPHIAEMAVPLDWVACASGLTIFMNGTVHKVSTPVAGAVGTKMIAITHAGALLIQPPLSPLLLNSAAGPSALAVQNRL